MSPGRRPRRAAGLFRQSTGWTISISESSNPANSSWRVREMLAKTPMSPPSPFLRSATNSSSGPSIRREFCHSSSPESVLEATNFCRGLMNPRKIAGCCVGPVACPLLVADTAQKRRVDPAHISPIPAPNSSSKLSNCQRGGSTTPSTEQKRPAVNLRIVVLLAGFLPCTLSTEWKGGNIWAGNRPDQTRPTACCRLPGHDRVARLLLGRVASFVSCRCRNRGTLAAHSAAARPGPGPRCR